MITNRISLTDEEWVALSCMLPDHISDIRQRYAEYGEDEPELAGFRDRRIAACESLLSKLHGRKPAKREETLRAKR